MTASAQEIIALHGATTTVERIRALMSFHGMSIRELSRQSGVHLSGLHGILTGRTKDPTVPTLRKIAAVLDTDVATLIGGE
jgi:transcriptional regulator with XRE-family HTH domain